MTLKEFAKAWKECKNNDERNKLNDELREKYGVTRAEFNEIYYEFKENQWQEELKEWEYEYLYDYFLEQLKKGNESALALDKRLKISLLPFKEMIKRDEIIMELENFYSINTLER